MLDPTGHYRVGAVTCWIQQSVSPKQVVGFSCLFNSEVDQLISKVIIVVLSSYVTPGPYFERTVRTSSKSLNGRKIARMAPILTIFGPNRSQRRNLFFEKFSNERRRHHGIVVVAVVAVVTVVGGFWVACIKGTSLLELFAKSLFMTLKY